MELILLNDDLHLRKSLSSVWRKANVKLDPTTTMIHLVLLLHKYTFWNYYYLTIQLFLATCFMVIGWFCKKWLLSRSAAQTCEEYDRCAVTCRESSGLVRCSYSSFNVVVGLLSAFLLSVCPFVSFEGLIVLGNVIAVLHYLCWRWWWHS